MKQEINAGYVILHKMQVGASIFALGQHPKTGMFVTWQARADAPRDYYWGHYMQDGFDAVADFGKRVTERAEDLKSRGVQYTAPVAERKGYGMER